MSHDNLCAIIWIGGVLVLGYAFYELISTMVRIATVIGERT
jgi:hypothetical protein